MRLDWAAPGTGLRRVALIQLKMVLLAPMAKARVKTERRVKPRLWRSWRRA
jgi:hypothetical protein